jgi:hypothetical protein
MRLSYKVSGILVCVAVNLLANACSEDTSAPADQQASEAPQSGETEFVSTYDPETDFNPDVLTEAYFFGDWCLAEIVLMGMTDKPNYIHTFLPEGHLLYQNEPDSDTRYGGNWKIEGGRLLINSASLTGTHVLTAVGPNEFVVDSKIVQTFRRGACELGIRSSFKLTRSKRR